METVYKTKGIKISVDQYKQYKDISVDNMRNLVRKKYVPLNMLDDFYGAALFRGDTPYLIIYGSMQLINVLEKRGVESGI